jgi:hypothetical protein
VKRQIFLTFHYLPRQNRAFFDTNIFYVPKTSKKVCQKRFDIQNGLKRQKCHVKKSCFFCSAQPNMPLKAILGEVKDKWGVDVND